MSERSDARVPLSVLVPVKNEAANLGDCLASVSFAEEIVLVDSASTDATQAIAEAAGARVVQFVWNEISGERRTGPWKISLGNMNGCSSLMPTNASRQS
jgi:glycosyltransferase involved in cell wall biosynthesis